MPKEPTPPWPEMSPLLRALAERGVVCRYRKGDTLIREGDPGDTLYIILAGRLRVYTVGDNEREFTHGHYGPGEYLGEMSLDGGLRSASVMTTEASSCAVVTRRTLEAYIAEQPAFAFELLEKVIRRARAATLSAKVLALNDVYGRLKALLEGNPEALQSTQKELAADLGCSREMVNRLVKDLERGGYLDVSGRPWRMLRALPARW